MNYPFTSKIYLQTTGGTTHEFHGECHVCCNSLITTNNNLFGNYSSYSVICLLCLQREEEHLHSTKKKRWIC